MKKIMIIGLIMLLLSGCDDPSSMKMSSDKIQLPDALQHCTPYRLTLDNGNRIVVIDCPFTSSTTAVRLGKNQQNAQLIQQTEESEK